MDETESFELGQPVHIRVLVTGANETQGRVVARTLLNQGHHVRGLVKDRNAPHVRALEDEGAEVVEGDFADPEMVGRVAESMDAAYLLATPGRAGPDAEAEEAIAAVDALHDAGVGHIVYSSVANADRASGVPAFDAKRRVEEHVKGAGGSYTILAPAFFMENLLGPQTLPRLTEGTLALPLPPDRELTMVPLANVAELALLALERREGLTGARVDVASDSLTGREMTELLEGTLEREIRYEEVSPDSVGHGGGEELSGFYAWLHDQGYDVDVDRVRAAYPDVSWLTFSEWARAQDWDAVLQRVEA